MPNSLDIMNVNHCPDLSRLAIRGKAARGLPTRSVLLVEAMSPRSNCLHE